MRYITLLILTFAVVAMVVAAPGKRRGGRGRDDKDASGKFVNNTFPLLFCRVVHSQGNTNGVYVLFFVNY